MIEFRTGKMTINKPVFLFYALSAIVFILPVTKAQAGFEWIPPSEMSPPQVENPAQSQSAEFPLPVSPDMPPVPNPAATVNSTPLDLKVPKPANTSGGLYINPFPNKETQQASPGDSVIGMGPVEQAMMEASHDLNPAVLGHGLTTAPRPQIRNVALPRLQKVSTGTKRVSPAPSSMSSSMTALPGEETAYAPGMETSKDMASSLDYSAMPMPAAPVRPMLPVMAGQYETIQGFGFDMPLALALTQVIPPSYALAFSHGVNPGTIVSWEGGKPWNEVLQDMLQSAGLTAYIQGQVVTVSGA